MIRVIVRHVDYGAQSYGADWPTPIVMRTFDIDAPELEKFLAIKHDRENREVIGAEVLITASRPRPTYNHTREDSELYPCPLCKRMQEES